MILPSKKKVVIVCITSLIFAFTIFYWSCKIDTLSCLKDKFPSAFSKLDVKKYKKKFNKKENLVLNAKSIHRNSSKIKSSRWKLKLQMEKARKKSNLWDTLAIQNKTRSMTNKMKNVTLRNRKQDTNSYLNSIVGGISSHNTTINERTNLSVKFGMRSLKRSPPKSTRSYINESDKEFSFNSPLRKTLSRKGILQFRNITCDPIYPDVLLYNRIFKTGSSSVSEYMKNISSHLGYFIEMATTEDWYNNGDSYPYPQIIEKHVARAASRIAFAGHYFFRSNLDIKKHYTYINFVREPVQRIISHYRYMRTNMRPTRRIIEMKESGLWNETILNCVKHQHRGCESNVMTRFFCGTKRFCRTGSLKALKLAKLNIKRYYAAVGLQEHMNLSLQILKMILPQFFDYPGIAVPQVKKNKSKNKSRNISAIELQIIRRRNTADVKLYNFVKKRFRTQLGLCGIHL